jgi:SAM-dependent methyltransferase
MGRAHSKTVDRLSGIKEPEGFQACRFCGAPLEHSFVSLGRSPLSNAYLKPDQVSKPEPMYPLHAYVCSSCFLVQLPEFEAPEQIFSDYAYFSSYSRSWLEHCKEYVETTVRRFNLSHKSFVVEIASNDGYLLQYFVERGIPVLGIEPAKNVARVARERGIPTESIFFGTREAQRLVDSGTAADLLIANNVLAHVPDLNDFACGLAVLLKPGGVITAEFPHLLRLVEGVQFDTIYHEHFSYFSFTTIERVFARHGLILFDVEEIPTHGGSLRIYARHAHNLAYSVSEHVYELRQREKDAGYTDISFYAGFEYNVQRVKERIIAFFDRAKREGKTIAGYGAPAKGNTLLNYCAISSDVLSYTVDRNPVKQGCYLPGSHIRIEAPEKIEQTKPDYLVILPWNLKDEIMEQMSFIREWGGKFVVLIPQVEVI